MQETPNFEKGNNEIGLDVLVPLENEFKKRSRL